MTILETPFELPCTRCKLLKPLDEFFNNRRYTNRFKKSYWCKECMKEHQSLAGKKETAREGHLRRRYGLSELEFNELATKQNYACAICREPHFVKPLCIDHDHDTGAVRGLLCNDCNLLLGRIDDNVETLKTAIEYLEGRLLFT